MKVAIIGAGWAGLAAAVEATRAGHVATVFEASRALGGRARGLTGRLPDGSGVTLDNGQHILIGAYTETLRLMRLVGVDPDHALLRLPLTLLFPDGQGLKLPQWRAPLDALAGIVAARGWRWRDKLALLRAATLWQRQRFACAPTSTVADLCRLLTARVVRELIEPLCVSALNTPMQQASGQVFLRVLRDALFGIRGGSNLLLPRTDLGTLFPNAAAQWLEHRGARVLTGHRAQALTPEAGRWQVDGRPFERVILACPPGEAQRLVEGSGVAAAQWLRQARALAFEAITTVYASSSSRLAQPLLALRSSSSAPAQFVFDRGQLGGPAGLLAFVVSASQGKRDALQQQVLVQGRQLGLQDLRPVQTVVEKRATFACIPGLQRPGLRIAAGLLACGDYVEGPYPATLEGALLSSMAAVQQL
ncbi:MAG: hydroxysqualene dehydroxylase HpnE [Burkholderiaceae bacterium]